MVVCLICFYVTVMNRQPVQLYPATRTVTVGERLQLPFDPAQKIWYRKWKEWCCIMSFVDIGVYICQSNEVNYYTLYWYS